MAVKGRYIAGLGAAGAALLLAGYLITGFESPGGQPVTHVYADPATGGAPWTYCDGETQNPRFGHVYSRAECDAETAALIRKVDAAVVACASPSLPPPSGQVARPVGGPVLTEPAGAGGQSAGPLPDQVRAAFDSLAWNIGTGAFCKSTAAKRARAGDLKGACAALAWFVYANGKQMPGLVFRRGEEKRLCLEGASSAPPSGPGQPVGGP